MLDLRRILRVAGGAGGVDGGRTAFWNGESRMPLDGLACMADGEADGAGGGAGEKWRL